ncbi:MAG: hypothetical protein ABL996_12860 [Micropepsaceae bacterium]
MPNPTAVTSFNLLPPTLRRTIHTAYDDAMETLEARQGCDKWLAYETIRMTVARHIVEQARHGECDVQRLRESALNVVHFDR